MPSSERSRRYAPQCDAASHASAPAAPGAAAGPVVVAMSAPWLHQVQVPQAGGEGDAESRELP
jgi:hypothetical protein